MCIFRTIKSQHIYDVPQEKLEELKQHESQSENTVSTDENAKKQMEITGRLQSSDGQSNERRNVYMFKHKKMSDQNSRSYSSKLKHRYDESLEMDTSMGPLHHNPAKLLTMEDSVKVLEEQQKLTDHGGFCQSVRRATKTSQGNCDCFGTLALDHRVLSDCGRRNT